MKLALGSPNKYDVYLKIVGAVEGNTGSANAGFLSQGVVSDPGAIPVVPLPYMYSVEVMASSSTNSSERAKLSVLYQY